MNHEGLVLALDQGTTSSRAILFDHAGAIVARASRELPQLYPAPGQVEHDPEAIWESQLAVARQVMAQAGVPASRLAAIGVTNQRETTIVWERATGRPVHNAIVWQSRVTAAYCDELRSRGLEPLIRARTGLPIDAYFSGPKIHHILASTPGLQERAERGELLFGTVDSFLIWRLTGGALHVTDVSNASRTLLFDIHRLAWDEELLAAMDIPAVMLPTVRPSSAAYGTTSAGLLGGAVTIGGDAGDQQAATFGQACFTPGMAKQTYGTGAFLLLNTGDRAVASEHGLLTTVGWQLRRGGDLRPRGLGLHRRGGGAVAAGRPRHHQGVGGCGGPGRAGGGHRRGLRRARLRRAGRPLLGPVCPRHDHRPDPRHAPWPTSRARRWTPWPTRLATSWTP